MPTRNEESAERLELVAAKARVLATELRKGWGSRENLRYVFYE